MKHFALYLYLITGITLMILYIPFFILLNPQDSSYEIIHVGVSLEGAVNVLLLISNIFRYFESTYILRIFHFGCSKEFKHSHPRSDMVYSLLYY